MKTVGSYMTSTHDEQEPTNLSQECCCDESQKDLKSLYVRKVEEIAKPVAKEERTASRDDLNDPKDG